MRIIGCLLIGLLGAVPSAEAQAELQKTRDVAECGYLSLMALAQHREAKSPKSTTEKIYRDTLQFAGLYSALSGVAKSTVSNENVVEMAKLGEAIHKAKIRAMSSENALRLSNRVLETCRFDLAIFKDKDLKG